MLFKNPKIGGLFDEFKDSDVLELADSVGEMTFDQTAACLKKANTRLPTKEELHFLVSIGVLKQGDKDCWSSSVNSVTRDTAWVFYGYYGYVDSLSRITPLGVRCVGRPCAPDQTTPTGPTASEASLHDVVCLLTEILAQVKK
jgi:hypothetical protein